MSANPEDDAVSERKALGRELLSQAFDLFWEIEYEYDTETAKRVFHYVADYKPKRKRGQRGRGQNLNPNPSADAERKRRQRDPAYAFILEHPPLDKK
jgi:hypothetical protein